MKNACSRIFAAGLRPFRAPSEGPRRSIFTALGALLVGGLAGVALEAGCGNGPLQNCQDTWSCPPQRTSDAGADADADGGADAGVPAAQCQAATDCPQPEDAVCGVAECAGGQCTLSFHEGPTISQVRGDCKRLECDGAGRLVQVADPTDAYNDGRECTVDKCEGSGPVNAPLMNGVTCPEIGFGHCYEGECVECINFLPPADDCPGMQACDAFNCVPADCAMTDNNGLKDGLETGTDCGGPCIGCPPKETCLVNSDCLHGVCNAGVCALPTHTDDVQNDGETGVDCGCDDCSPCPVGGGCLTGENCQSHVCWAGKCDAPSCKDGVENGLETGVDCGGECPACP